MTDALYRTIVGGVIPLVRNDDFPKQYRRTQVAVPPAPVSEAEVPPITVATNPLSLHIGADHGIPE